MNLVRQVSSVIRCKLEDSSLIPRTDGTVLIAFMSGQTARSTKYVITEIKAGDLDSDYAPSPERCFRVVKTPASYS